MISIVFKGIRESPKVDLFDDIEHWGVALSTIVSNTRYTPFHTINIFEPKCSALPACRQVGVRSGINLG